MIRDLALFVLAGIAAALPTVGLILGTYLALH